MTILSTKILTDTQRELLKGYVVKEVSMIDISFGTGFKITEKIENAVFTSANSVRSVFEIHKNKPDWFGTVYCVGTKTQSLLEKNGVSVSVVANNAIELADVLVQQFTKDKSSLKEINWFCGNLRNQDLPNIMAENGVLVTEYPVYQTNLSPEKVETASNAILFFSPSGVKSYLQKNKADHTPVICIGVTTATEAIQSFDNVYISDSQSVEGVIEKTKEIIEYK